MSLRFVVLGVLNREPNTGYGIARLLRGEMRHVWEARLQQIYSELAALRSAGLVEAEEIELPNRPAKKVYSLTRAGREALQARFTAPLLGHSCKDELLVRLYFLERLPAHAAQHCLEERRGACEREAVELRQRLAQADRAGLKDLGHVLTLDAALSRAEAEAGWCARALARLSAGARAAPPPEEEAAGEAEEQERAAGGEA